MRSFYCKPHLASDQKDLILKLNSCHFAKRKKCVCSEDEVSFAIKLCLMDSKTSILAFKFHHTTLIFLGDLDIILSQACIFYL